MAASATSPVRVTVTVMLEPSVVVAALAVKREDATVMSSTCRVGEAVVPAPKVPTVVARPVARSIVYNPLAEPMARDAYAVPRAETSRPASVTPTTFSGPTVFRVPALAGSWRTSVPRARSMSNSAVLVLPATLLV